MVTNKQLEFYNYPDDSSLNDYERSRDYIIDRVSQYPGVVALYEYGVVGAPGLSDLDFIVVLQDQLPIVDLTDLIYLRDVPAFVEKTLDGSILRTMSREHYSKVLLLGNILTRKLWGESIDHHPLNETELLMVKISDVMDWLPERILMLGDYANMESAPVKRLVGCLHSLQHSINRTFDIDSIFQQEKILDFIERLRVLLKNWFIEENKFNKQTIIQLLNEGISLGLQLMRQVDEYMIAKGFYPRTSLNMDAFFYINPQKGYRFPVNNLPTAININPAGYLSIDVPLIWLAHLKQYAKGEGIISDLIKTNISTNRVHIEGVIDPVLVGILNRRMQLCDNMATFLKMHGLYRAMYRFAHIKNVNTQEEQ